MGPLAVDNVFMISLTGTAPAVFTNYAGVLNGQGNSQATVNIPPINALIGLNIHSAFVTLKTTAPLGLQSISNHYAFTIR